jgi:predicted dehydrogenase
MLIGEMCHFVDVMRSIAGASIEAVTARALQTGSDLFSDSDNLTLILEFENGSVGTLSYNTLGNKSFAKERLEIYGGGDVCSIDDFRRMEIVTGSKKKLVKGRQDKGQSAMIRETITSVRTQGRGPIPFAELEEVMAAIFAAKASLATGRPERPTDYFEPRPA